MSTSSPVEGFLPIRDFLLVTLKVPNPGSFTSSPAISFSLIKSKKKFTISADSLLENPISSYKTPARSFFVMKSPPF